MALSTLDLHGKKIASAAEPIGLMANRPPAVISCTSYPDTVQKDGVGPGTLIPGGSASAMPEVCADDDSKGYTGVRIQPVDSKIRLQLTKKQVCLCACSHCVSVASPRKISSG